MINEKYGLMKLTIFLIIVGVFISSLVLCLYFFVFLGESKVYEYQYYTFNHQTNSSTKSTIKLGEKISESVNYFRNGNFIIISPLTEKDFRCTGSCHCVDEERRIPAHIFGRILFLIVPSITLITAVELARRYFRKKCQEDFWENCDVEKLVAEVNECEEFTNDEKVFDCEGWCIPTDYFGVQGPLLEYAYEACGEYKLSKLISVTGRENEIESFKKNLERFCRGGAVIDRINNICYSGDPMIDKNIACKKKK